MRLTQQGGFGFPFFLARVQSLTVLPLNYGCRKTTGITSGAVRITFNLQVVGNLFRGRSVRGTEAARVWKTFSLEIIHRPLFLYLLAFWANTCFLQGNYESLGKTLGASPS